MNKPLISSSSPPRQWQINAVEAARRILIEEDRDHLYIQAPTASGKSRAMLEIIDNVSFAPPSSAHYIVIGLTDIVDQHVTSFVEDGCIQIDKSMVVTPGGNLVVVTTWQNLAAKAKRKTVLDHKIGYVFFDECHVGGSGNDITSIQSIYDHFLPIKRCMISATTLTANEDILGIKKDHFFSYSMEDAMEDGILHPVNLIEVHAGVNAKIAKLNRDLESRGTNIQQLDELFAEDGVDLAGQFTSRGVVIDPEMMADYRQLSELRIDAATRIYLNKHQGEQALVFLANIDTADKARQKFDYMAARYRNRHGGRPIHTMALHSKTLVDQGIIVEQFRARKIDVLFVVGMLQEGFSHNPLALAFDCVFRTQWNASSTSRLIQRVGRLMRLHKSKVDPSRYYFFRDILDLYPMQNVSMPDFDLNVDDRAEWNQRDDILRESAEIFAAKVIAQTESQNIDPSDDSVGDNTVSVPESTVEYFDGVEIDTSNISSQDVAIKLVTTPIWYLKNIRDHREIQQFSFRNLFPTAKISKSKVDEYKQELLEVAQTGGRRPIATTKLGSTLCRYTTTRASDDPNFNKKIRKLRPDWFAERNSHDDNKRILLEMAARNEYPKRETGFEKHFKKYVILNSPRYDRDFCESIARIRPEWLVKSMDANKRNLLELARAGDARPSAKKNKNRLAAALTRYTRPNGDSYDETFDKKIRAVRPDWFLDSSAENKRVLLEMASSGLSVPSTSTSLGGAFSRYTSKKSVSYDSNFEASICVLRPDWFINPIEEQTKSTKKALLDLAKTVGSERPRYKESRLGKYLTLYTSVGSKKYDAEFYNGIQSIRPDWFADTTADNKAQILKLAEDMTASRPLRNKLSSALTRYIAKNGSSYDAAFDKKMRALRPDWFARLSQTKVDKAILLRLAETGAPRPTQTTRIGQKLKYHTTKLSRRSEETCEFNEQIRKLRPDWFDKTAAETKEAIINLAKNGKAKPKSTCLLGKTMHNFFAKGSVRYDPNFKRELMELIPDWFIDPSEEKKHILLEMAMNGDPRPKNKSKLSVALGNYLCQSCTCFDDVFSVQIRSLRPDWFKQ